MGIDVVLHASFSRHSRKVVIAKAAYKCIGRVPFSVQVILALAADFLVLQQGLNRRKGFVGVGRLAPRARASSRHVRFKLHGCARLARGVIHAAVLLVRNQCLLRFETLVMASWRGIGAS